MKTIELGGRDDAMNEKWSPEKNGEVSYDRNLIKK